MSVTINTIKELSDNIIAQLEATLNQSIPNLAKSFFRVLSRSIAAVYIQLYKYIGFGTLQQFVKTASDQPTTINGIVLTPLYELGELVGVGLPAPATRAEVTVRVVVEAFVGTLPSGSQLTYPLTGVTYITLNAVNLDAPTKDVTVRAVASQDGGDGSGTIGNVPVSEFLQFANPLSNVARQTEVIAEVTTGANGEDIDVYRQRVQNTFRARPQGGALADYRLWGEEPAGIVNVYPYRDENCPGQVLVYSEATPESSGDPDGIPTTPQLQEVEDSINFNEGGLATRRPTNDSVSVLAITRTDFEVVVVGLDVTDPATVEAQITTAIEEYFAEREPFIIGLDFSPRFDRITASAIGGIVDDVVSAAGGVFISVTLLQSAISLLNYELGAGEKAKVSSVSFTA